MYKVQQNKINAQNKINWKIYKVQQNKIKLGEKKCKALKSKECEVAVVVAHQGCEAWCKDIAI